MDSLHYEYKQKSQLVLWHQTGSVIIDAYCFPHV